jgi:hypothetical protein
MRCARWLRPGVWRRTRLDVRREPVSVLRNGFDPGRAELAQCLAQGGDLKRQAGLLHIDVAPDDAEQLVLRKESPLARHEDGQKIECPRRQRYDRAVTREDARLGVEPERAEVVRGARGPQGCPVVRVPSVVQNRTFASAARKLLNVRALAL